MKNSKQYGIYLFEKINVNERSFNMNMKECLDGKKLSIFGKLQQKSAKNVRNNILI